MQVDYEVKPAQNECFREALFRLWYDPLTLKHAKGILTVCPGSGADGRNDVYQWAGFARAHNLLVLGIAFSDVNPKVDEDYIDAKSGSGRALVEAQEAFEIDLDDMPMDLPLYMWGHSAGGEFNYEFACWAPSLVAAFVVNKGGIYYTGLAPTETRAIPAAFFTGGKDAEYRRTAVRSIYYMGAVSGAKPWTLWNEPDAHHEVGQSRRIAETLFIDTLAARVKEA